MLRSHPKNPGMFLGCFWMFKWLFLFFFQSYGIDRCIDRVSMAIRRMHLWRPRNWMQRRTVEQFSEFFIGWWTNRGPFESLLLVFLHNFLVSKRIAKVRSWGFCCFWILRKKAGSACSGTPLPIIPGDSPIIWLVLRQWRNGMMIQYDSIWFMVVD